jgi:hypothetical protein
MGVPSIIAVDSSEHWLNEVAGKCAEANLAIQPHLIFADIGPTSDWGHPIDQSGRERWPDYAKSAARAAGAELADLYLVDGRFRVSCFLKIMQSCRADAIILFHDFSSRPAYHIVRRFAREVAVASDLSVFVPLPVNDRQEFAKALEHAKYDPA